MRARERARVERHAARALGLVAPGLRLLVGWTRTGSEAWGPGTHAEAFMFLREGCVVIDELVFAAGSSEDREDTIRHELAHLVAWHRHGHEIASHGREWERARRDIDAALEEDE